MTSSIDAMFQLYTVHHVAPVLAAIIVGLVVTPWVRHAIWRLGGSVGNIGVGAVLVAGLVMVTLMGPPAIVDRARIALALIAGVVVGAVDLARRRIPDVVLRPSYLVVGVSLVVQAAMSSSASGLLRAALVAFGAVVWHAGCCLVGAIGAGDVKLAGLLGLLLGWSSWGSVVVAVLASTLIAAVVGVVGLVRCRSRVAFGPVLIVGAGIGLMVSLSRTGAPVCGRRTGRVY